MKKILALTILIVATVTVNAQTLLYRWAFNNPADTTNASAATYAVTPGTGNLEAKNASGNATGTIGLDGINPIAYYTTNTTAGPGSTNGAYVLNGQNYGGGNAAVSWATNLNIGSSAQFTLTYWIRFDAAFPIANGQLPRLMMIGASQTYDNGGVNGVGNSINANPGSQSFQAGLGNSASGSANWIIAVANAFPVGGPYSGNNGGAAGLPQGNGTANSGTWIFVAVTYDSLLSASNYTVRVGTTNQAVLPWDNRNFQSSTYGIINFSTNASIFMGNRLNGSRGLTLGAISDVRFYSGVCSQADLDKIRLFQQPDLTNSLPSPPVVVSQPVSGKTFSAGSRTFSVSASGNPATFTYLWRSNGVAVTGGTNSSLTVSNVQTSANGATFICSITNVIGGTNTTAATLTVVSPVPGSYAEGVYTNNPYSLWFVNEPSNNVVTVYDYRNGQDGEAKNPANNLFLDGPSSTTGYPGFSATNTSIETINGRASQLNLGSPVNFPNTGMTICGWMRTPTGAGGNGIIYDLASDGFTGYGITHSGGAVSYQWGPAAPASGFTTGVIPNANEWTFVALVITTNLTAADIANSITADTNVTVYVGSHTLGLQSGTDSSALNASTMANGTSSAALALGRTTFPASENGIYYAIDTSDFNGVAVFYSALSAQTITNLYLTGAGLYLNGTPDVNSAGNLLLTYPLGTLQGSTNVAGPYTDVSGSPASPDSVPMTDPQHFYRVRN